VLVNEIGQASTAADGRVDHRLDLLLGATQRHLGDPVQHRVLVPHPLELLDELVGDLLLRARVDLMHGLVEQLDEGVGDLALAQMQQRGRQDQPNRLIVAGEMAGRLDRSPCTPCGGDVRGDSGEQVGGQVDLADDLELSHLRDHDRETHVPRARLDRAQRVLTGLRITPVVGGRLGVHVDAGAQQRLERRQRERPHAARWVSVRQPVRGLRRDPAAEPMSLVDASRADEEERSRRQPQTAACVRDSGSSSKLTRQLCSETIAAPWFALDGAAASTRQSSSRREQPPGRPGARGAADHIGVRPRYARNPQ
jgi:hypothetical protein